MPIATRKRPKSPRVRRLRRWLYPRGLENQFSTELRKMVAAARKQIIEQLFPLFPLWDIQVEMSIDSERADQWPLEVANAVESLKIGFQGAAANVVPSTVEALGREVVNVNRDEWIAIAKSVLGVVPAAGLGGYATQVEAFSLTTTGLITKLTDEMYGQVRERILDGYRAGKRSTAIKKELLSMGKSLPPGPFKKASTRATLIARDQVEKLNSEITRLRQTDAGVEKYVWRTAGDNRVRDEHAAREGEIFQWKSPPPDGHPGEAINCRCFAEPVLDELENL